MLEKLLNEIRAGGTLETNALAARLDVSSQMVQAMLEYLYRAGKIRPYVPCSDGCGSCGLQSSCTPGQRADQFRLWQTVEETGY
jgi:hypothetical protein